MHNQQYALPNYVHKGSCRASVQQILATLFSTVCWVPGFLAPQELSDSEYSLAPSCVHPFENDVASSSSLLKKHAAPCCTACNVRTLLRTYRASTMQLIRLGSISLPQRFVQRTHYLIGHFAFLGEISARSSSESLDLLFT